MAARRQAPAPVQGPAPDQVAAPVQGPALDQAAAPAQVPAPVLRARPSTPAQPETALYAPVKELLEAQGYDVKGEVRGCDLVGVRGDEPPVIVELKRTFGLGVVYQALDRLAMADAVYVAVGAWPAQEAEARRLCRRIGLGLIVVTGQHADVVVDPLPYQPRRDRKRATLLLGEHRRRVGDPTEGGSTRRPIMTAYRQEAMRIAGVLVTSGPSRVRDVRAAAEAPNAGRILRDDVYGWFERVNRGVYALTAKGRAAITT